MEDLSLHILDIVENSVRAGAEEIEIRIKEDTQADSLEIEIRDDGSGMDAQTQERALDPFFTTKSVRKVGLGLSLFREAARESGGDLEVESVPGEGTRIKATFKHSHIDRRPLGDMARTLQTLMIGSPDIRYRYIHQKDGQEIRFDSSDNDVGPENTTEYDEKDSSLPDTQSTLRKTVEVNQE